MRPTSDCDTAADLAPVGVRLRSAARASRTVSEQAPHARRSSRSAQPRARAVAAPPRSAARRPPQLPPDRIADVVGDEQGAALVDGDAGRLRLAGEAPGL